jgi:MOSC domain-containing protein YiiM
MNGRVVSVNVSQGGVPKRPIPRAWVTRLGLEADGHFEPEPIHGGLIGAVCLYTVESIERVAADGHAAFPGAFGENLTLQGIELGELGAGDRLRIGDAGLVIELTKHAAPCQTQGHWFIDRRIARISPKIHPEDARWYASVVSEGWVAPGDRVELVRSGGGPSTAAVGDAAKEQQAEGLPAA